MSIPHKLFQGLGLDPEDASAIRVFAARSGVAATRLKHLDFSGTFPLGRELAGILSASGLGEVELKLRLGCFDSDVADAIRNHASEIARVIQKDVRSRHPRAIKQLTPALQTGLGLLYQGDCLDLLARTDNDSVDLIFADPPFNLNKIYPSGIDDNLKAERYLAWCEDWIAESARVLKPGGSLFLWNLPKWNSALAAVLNRRLTFRHWIAVDIKYTLPISGRLYPSHYALLYYIKGEKPNTFEPDRLPMEVCPDCRFDLKDYGGYKDKMNPRGINLSDVWYDIPPVRHAKYKRRKDANELSIKLLDRVIEMASKEGDLVFDPFGGSGTTYVVAEMKRRRWLGVELGPVTDIEARFKRIDEEASVLERARRNLNMLFSPETLRERTRRGLWTAESERARKATLRDHAKNHELQELDFG